MGATINNESIQQNHRLRTDSSLKHYSQEKKIRKKRLFKKVQAFCEEKVLRYLLEVLWYAESKNQFWQPEKWRLHYLICIFPRWPPNWKKSIKTRRVTRYGCQTGTNQYKIIFS